MLLISGNIMNNDMLKMRVEEKAVVRLLKTISDGNYHTRELLNILGEWGYGHKLLMKAYKLGLVHRERTRHEGRGNWRVYNRLTKKGKQVIRLARQIGI